MLLSPGLDPTAGTASQPGMCGEGIFGQHVPTQNWLRAGELPGRRDFPSIEPSLGKGGSLKSKHLTGCALAVCAARRL